MKLNKLIIGFFGSAALMTGMTNMGVSLNRPAQASMATRANSPKIVKLQQDLKADGFNPGPIDGIIGDKTKAAVLAFQKAHSFYPDGIAGAKTLAALNSTNAQAVSAKPNQENVPEKPENNEGSKTPTATTTTPTTGNTNQVPTSVSEVGEVGENIYDAAKAKDWTQASAKLNSLQDAAKKLDKDNRINENSNEDQLDKVLAALNKSVSAKDQLATMRDANRVTLLAANLSAPFNPLVPVSIVYRFSPASAR